MLDEKRTIDEKRFIEKIITELQENERERNIKKTINQQSRAMARNRQLNAIIREQKKKIKELEEKCALLGEKNDALNCDYPDCEYRGDCSEYADYCPKPRSTEGMIKNAFGKTKAQL